MQRRVPMFPLPYCTIYHFLVDNSTAGDVSGIILVVVDDAIAGSE